EVTKPPPCLENSSPPSRIPEPESPAKPNVPTASTAPPADSRDRRRSYQMPVRDEESESQRKARSRLMRQSRRSTQGVTLTDLKEAEKAAGKAEPADRSQESSTLEGGPSARRQRSQRDLNPEPEPESEEPDGGFRTLYAELRRENERLREALTETTLRLAQLKVELERATQRQERFAERPALLELERFERRALERKAAELEEELKALSDLRADNQRLKDENAALIRVISKLSK
ncbi:PPP1R12C isoform 8, partial [Pan troglodytes]